MSESTTDRLYYTDRGQFVARIVLVLIKCARKVAPRGAHRSAENCRSPPERVHVGPLGAHL